MRIGVLRGDEACLDVRTLTDRAQRGGRPSPFSGSSRTCRCAGGRTADWFGPRGEAEPDSDAGRRASVLRWPRRPAHGRLACRLPRCPPSGHGPRNPHRTGARGRQPAAQCMQWGAMGGSRKRSSKRPRQRCVTGRCWQKRYAVEVLPGRGARRADPPAKLTDRASAP